MKNGEYNLVIAPSDYSGKLYRGKYCYEHYLVYWKHYGVIPNKEQIIHHKDGNKRNNNIDNLILMDRIEHIVHHEKARQKKMLLLKCPVCEKIFIKEKRQTCLQKPSEAATYCSRECVGKATYLKKTNNKEFQHNLKTNIIKEFLAS